LYSFLKLLQSTCFAPWKKNVAEIVVEHIRLQRCAIEEQHAEEWQFADYMSNGEHKLITETCIISHDVTIQRVCADSYGPCVRRKEIRELR
jgi:hypothetical protein